MVVETVGSVCWLAMDAAWMLGWRAAGTLLAVPCVLAHLLLFRFTPRTVVAIGVTVSMFCLVASERRLDAGRRVERDGAAHDREALLPERNGALLICRVLEEPLSSGGAGAPVRGVSATAVPPPGAAEDLTGNLCLVATVARALHARMTDRRPCPGIRLLHQSCVRGQGTDRAAPRGRTAPAGFGVWFDAFELRVGDSLAHGSTKASPIASSGSSFSASLLREALGNCELGRAVRARRSATTHGSSPRGMKLRSRRPSGIDHSRRIGSLSPGAARRRPRPNCRAARSRLA